MNQIKFLDLWTHWHVDVLRSRFDRALDTGENRVTLQGFAFLFPDAPMIFPDYIIKSMFRCFDVSGTGSLSFRDYCYIMALCTLGSFDEKLHFLFRMFDSNSDGYLEETDLQLIIESCNRATVALAERNGTNPRSFVMISNRGTGLEFGEDFINWAFLNLDAITALCDFFTAFPSALREKEICLRLASPVIEPESTVYLISYRWLQTWKAYVHWNLEDEPEFQLVESPNGSGIASPRATDPFAGRPGCIDNSDLLDSAGALRPGLVEHFDFGIVAGPVWRALLVLYGGGPELARRALPGRKAELYPLRLRLRIAATIGSEDTRIITVSGQDSVFGIGAVAADRFLSKNAAFVFRQSRAGDASARIVTCRVGGRFFGANVTISSIHGDDCEYSISAEGCDPGDLSVIHTAPAIWTPACSSELWLALGKGVAAAHSNSLGSSTSATGLRNLGNTCFMNAVLQCLASTEYLKDYFVSGRYRRHFKRPRPASLADQLNELLAAMGAAGGQRTVAPAGFKKVLGRVAPQFAGCEQQDAHELLSVLLEALHCDLNRSTPPAKVSVKGTISTKSDDDSVSSHESKDEGEGGRLWEEHRRANVSVITDLFEGQLAFSTACSSCAATTRSFEVFRYIPLSVCSKTPLLFSVAFFDRAEDRFRKVSVPATDTLHELLIKLARTWPSFDWLGGCVALAEVCRSRTEKILDCPSSPLAEFRAEAEFFAFETAHRLYPPLLPPESSGRSRSASLGGVVHSGSELRRQHSFNQTWSATPIFLVIVLHRRRNKRRANQQLFGFPLVLSFRSVGGLINCRDLTSAITSTARRILSSVDFTSISLCGPRGVACAVCDHRDCSGCALPRSGVSASLPVHGGRLYVALEWDTPPETLTIPRLEHLEPPALPEEVPRAPPSVTGSLDAFFADEQLQDWQCSCGERSKARRLVEVVRTPEVLILVVKRFVYSDVGGCSKLHDSVAIPKNDLRFGKERFDLFAVIDHLGGLSSGHYTATVKEEDGTWTVCDDSETRSLQGQDIDETSKRTCYLLFYRKRNPSVPTLITYARSASYTAQGYK